MIRDVVTVRDRIRIHYRRLGQGPGMVLLHGYPQTGHMWRKVMPALAERFTVLAPDLRGYGDSDRPATGYDKRTMAADVADVVRTLGLGPVVLVGHDRGARVAHRFALDHVALLSHLVLLDIAPTATRRSRRRRWCSGARGGARRPPTCWASGRRGARPRSPATPCGARATSSPRSSRRRWSTRSSNSWERRRSERCG